MHVYTTVKLMVDLPTYVRILFLHSTALPTGNIRPIQTEFSSYKLLYDIHP
jgi:hypothetical protein